VRLQTLAALSTANSEPRSLQHRISEKIVSLSWSDHREGYLARLCKICQTLTVFWKGYCYPFERPPDEAVRAAGLPKD
jgi:hypothetical protein